MAKTKKNRPSILDLPMNWRTIFDLANVIMVFLDDNQTVSMINLKGCEVLNMNEEDIVGKNWFDHFIPSSERKKVKAVYDEIMKGNLEPYEQYENNILNKKGKKVKVFWSNSYLRDSKGCIRFTLSAGQLVKKK